jgi:2-phosphosulfolactate phosphatase
LRRVDTGLSIRAERTRTITLVQIEVALTYKLLREPRRYAVAVVDVLRASTSLIVMHENGLLRSIITENIQQARQVSRANFSLLCGEVRAVPPAGFDYGNSPAEFATLSFKGKSAVIMTTNGTRAIASAADAPFVCIAALTNRRAAARRLLEEATALSVDISVVCAAADRGATFALEDTVAAGALVEAAREADPALHLSDSAWAAYHLWRWYGGDAMRAFRQARHGRGLLEKGFEHDLRYASRLDISSTVPTLTIENGLRTLRARSVTQKSESAS